MELELTCIFHLENQIYPLIPKEFLKHPTSNRILTYQECNISIIGNELPKSISAPKLNDVRGQIIVSFSGYKNKQIQTFIAYFDLYTKELHILFISKPITCVGASFTSKYLGINLKPFPTISICVQIKFAKIQFYFFTFLGFLKIFPLFF